MLLRNLVSPSFSDADVLEETPAVKPLKWEEDMQLFSRFLDRKVHISNTYKPPCLCYTYNFREILHLILLNQAIQAILGKEGYTRGRTRARFARVNLALSRA